MYEIELINKQTGIKTNYKGFDSERQATRQLCRLIDTLYKDLTSQDEREAKFYDTFNARVI